MILEEALISADVGGACRRPPQADHLPADAPVLPGDVAFRLHDTYGFPIDLTVELAAEYGVRIDLAGFQDALAEQRQRSRSRTQGRPGGGEPRRVALRGRSCPHGRPTEFMGYESTSGEARVVAILRDGVEYETLEPCPGAAPRPPRDEIVLDRTPFYAESGGQVGDIGASCTPATGPCLFDVDDSARPARRRGADRAPRRLRGRIGSATSSLRRWMRHAGRTRCATTRAPTCSIARCATWWGIRPARRGRWSPGLPAVRLPFERGLRTRRSGPSRPRFVGSSAKTAGGVDLD